jgi:hypothetical protein
MVSSEPDAVLTNPDHHDSAVTVAMEHLSPSSGRPPQHPPRSLPGVLRRDAGLALINRVNGWLITGAVVGAGLLSFVAAHAFHGHTVSRDTRASSASNASRGASAPHRSSRADGGLQAPTQAPAPAAPAAAPVVSGGS